MEDLSFLQTSFSEVKNQGPLPHVFIVEDDRSLSQTLTRYLAKVLNVPVRLFETSMDFLSYINTTQDIPPFCLITDISLEEGADGLLLVDYIKEKNVRFVCIAMTGFASIESAINATKKGVYHYLTKPFDIQVLRDLVSKAILETFGHNSISTPRVDTEKSYSGLVKRLSIEAPSKEDIFCGIIGRSKAMKVVFEKIQRVATSDSTVLITGPSGTGKELVANAIHRLSERRDMPRVSVNCGAIPSELLESELFGHVKGSFTGAIANRKGRFEMADKGSIFLDEIGDMPLLLQVKILRVLQARQIEPVGANITKDIDVRLIAATHRNLEVMVQDGSFREDLFYRLNVIPIKIPALKDRREDIPLLIGYFLDRFVSADRSNAISFSDEALSLLLGYDWPGNVRELENMMERLVILKGGDEVTPEDLPASVFVTNSTQTKCYKSLFNLPDDGVDLKQLLNDIEDSLIMQALERSGGNKNQASKYLKLNRTTLIEKMKKKEMPL